MRPALRIQPRLQVATIAQTAHARATATGVPGKPVEPVPQAGLEGGGESVMKTVPEVVEAIGQISNYFGASAGQSSEQHTGTSGQPHDNVAGSEKSGQPIVAVGGSDSSTTFGGKTAEIVGQSASEQSSTTIGQLSHDAIGRLAGEIAQNLKGTTEEAGVTAIEVPSYAPEKCIISDGAYSIRQESGKGSLHADTALEAGKDGVSKLEGMLVSEKDIFGAPLPERRENSEEVCHGDIGDEGARRAGVRCNEKFGNEGAGVRGDVEEPDDKGAGVHLDETSGSKGAGIRRGSDIERREGAGVRRGTDIEGPDDEKAGVRRDSVGPGSHEDSDDGASMEMGEDWWDQMSDVSEEDAGSKGASKSGCLGDGNHGSAPLSSSQTEMLEEFKKLTSVTEDQSISSKTCQILGSSVLYFCVIFCVLGNSKKRGRQVRNT